MKQWVFMASRAIAGRSYHVDKSGQIPQDAKRMLTFKNIITGKMSRITDLDLKKQKRGYILKLFLNIYSKSFKKKELTVFLIVVDENIYGLPSKFISNFKRKLIRKGIRILGYVWQKDVGEIRFEKHFHFIIITRRLEKGILNSLFKNKKVDAGYSFELCRSISRFKNYLNRKEIYAAKGKRSFGRSGNFNQLL